MKRLVDVILSLCVLILIVPLLLIVALVLKLTSDGPVLYWSVRYGRDNVRFLMPKFRTMIVSAPEVATHLLVDPNDWLTPVGSFLRKTSLDELPQLWSILVGDMSLVGPRPALHNQTDLIQLRTQLKVHRLTPGLTGWAQLNGRDDLNLTDKVRYDAEYLARKSIMFDLKILALTVISVIRCRGVRQ